MTVVVQDPLELLRDFADEALASLRTLPAHLEAYRTAPSSEPINAVFRGIHSLKGNAGFFGLNVIKSFAHSVENTLDEIRTQQAPISEELERSLIASFDYLDEMVSAAIAGEMSDELPPDAQQLLDTIVRQAGIGTGESSRPEDMQHVLQCLRQLQVPGLETPVEWLETVADSMLDVLEASLRGASQPGTAADTTTPAEAGILTPIQLATTQWNCPEIDLAQQLQAVLHLFVAFEKQEYTPAVGEAFIAQAESLAEQARVCHRHSLAEAFAAAAKNFRLLAASPIPLDDMLISVVWDNLCPELSKLIAPRAVEPTPSAVVPPATAIAPTTNAPASAAPAKDSHGRLIRVKEERLDEFLNLVARLFITGEMFKDLQSRMAESRQLKPMVEEFREIIRSFSEQAYVLQKGLFSLRRVPAANLFSKFPGMARGLARQLGKEVDVRLVGEEIEIDKALIEDLDAPLTHIIRNAVDHGIDPPDDRAARGASRTGQLTMTAELTRSHVRIVVTDNGRGIDARRIRAKALEKGLFVASELEAMSDDEAVQLIFHPGFSTAEKLSDVSGRGVGLDVVRNSVRKHQGEVYVSSQLNVGTTFRLDLPLREAVLVIDGLMICHDGQEFVIPFEFIREITQLEPHQLAPFHGAQVATIRGTVYDARRLSAVLAGAAHDRDDKRALSAVVVGTQFGHMCLLVDQVLGTRKVVVNGLKDIVCATPSVAGVAQLGGGRLALVLSIPEIVNRLIVSHENETLAK